MKNTVSTIRYMGNKTRLISHLNEVFDALTKDGDCICDLMAGTNSVGYARIQKNKIISNDIQYYSFIIAEALLKKDEYLKSGEVIKMYHAYKGAADNLFLSHYADTYFSAEQCKEIDKIRSFIDTLIGRAKSVSLVALMNSMCKAQSTPGHFAQFLSKDNERVAPLRKMSIEKLYMAKLAELDKLLNAKYKNETYNLDVSKLLANLKNKKVSCYYLDPPYTGDQYSRFYHLLDTACKYDNPTIDTTKAKYRADRFKSDFCYKDKVANAFESIIKFCNSKKAHLVISYSTSGVLAVDSLMALCKKFYENVKKIEIDYSHSSQGKGIKKTKEIIVICKGE